MTTVKRTTCPYCGVGCGLLATVSGDGTVTVAGDPEHPANRGRLCSKGAALAETLSLDDRLLSPTIGGRPASWEAALDLVADRFSQTIAAHGPDSVAFYVSGQLLTEDYYVANKLMKGFIGSGNIDTNSRLCMASSVAGHKRAFGSDTVPVCYEDLEEADLVVLVGSNLAWCHPVLYQRLVAAREKRGTKVVVIDPRQTETCAIADLHLAIAPGTDVAVFNGLLLALAGGNALDAEYIAAHTTGFREALAAAMRMPISAVARMAGVSQADLYDFYDMFVSTPRVVTVWSQGVNQSSAGTDKVNAIINCHLATGRIGKPGMGPFSVTGQPNAMGGREVGGLATMLAGHMEFDNPEHRRIVEAFWQAPRLAQAPGLKAVDLFRAVGDGRIKALWIMGTNPAASMPEADAVSDAIRRCPFVVVSDVVRNTDTLRLAGVALPSAAWGEKNGTVTNSERRISRQRAFLPVPGSARPDWWQLAEVARRMGYAESFAWQTPAEIFAEHVGLTVAANGGRRDLDLGDFAGRDYEALTPSLWPRGRERLFADGGFFTPDRRARMVPVTWRAPAEDISAAYPMRFNTGRVRDQWHTMTRTGKSARLLAHMAEPYLEVHPDDAAKLELKAAGLARVKSAQGEVLLRVVVTPRQRPGSVFAPMHWTGETAAAARIDAVAAGATDPVSGQPELKATPVAVTIAAMAWYGFAVSRAAPEYSGLDYWALARAAYGWRLEFAAERAPDDWAAQARRLLRVEADVELIGYHDGLAGQHRFAAFEGDGLVGAVFFGREPVGVSRSWAAEQLGATFADPQARLAILAGRPRGAAADAGPIVCACLQVGRNVIVDCVRAGCASLDAVAKASGAGSSCGSCRPEISRLLMAQAVA